MGPAWPAWPGRKSDVKSGTKNADLPWDLPWDLLQISSLKPSPRKFMELKADAAEKRGETEFLPKDVPF